MAAIKVPLYHHNFRFRYHFPLHQPRFQVPCPSTSCLGQFVWMVTLFSWVVATMTSPSTSSSSSSSSQRVRVSLLCDSDSYSECLNASRLMVAEAATSTSQPSSAPAISLRVSVVRIPEEQGVEGLRTLAEGRGGDGEVLVAVGGGGAVRMVRILGEGVDRPVLGYVRDDSWKDSTEPLSTEAYFAANAYPSIQGSALALLIGQYNLPKVFVLIQDTFLASGFLEGFGSKVTAHEGPSLARSVVTSQMTDHAIHDVLKNLAQTGRTIIVLHCYPSLSLRVIQLSTATSLMGTGHTWFLTEAAMVFNTLALKTLPVGVLGLQSFYQNGTTGFLLSAARTVRCAYACMQECVGGGSTHVPSSSLVSGEKDVSSSLPLSTSSSSFEKSSSSVSQSVQFSSLKERFRISCNDSTQYFAKCVRYSPQCQQPPSSSPNSSSIPLLHTGTAFHLLNLATTASGDREERIWANVGVLSASGHTDLRRLVWSGRTLSRDSVRTYRVVTRPAKPFVFVEGPVMSGQECLTDVPCLRLRNSSKDNVVRAVEDFLSTRHLQHSEDYQVYCCNGLSIDLLRRLAEDLSFQFLIYFVNDSNYGEVVNRSWTGMVGDVMSGAADMVVGAFSMTSSRMEVISYTEPFYHNEFAMVSGEDGRSPSIWAFLKPFSAQVWTCILVSSVVAGVATSFLEWRSPFGLNPRGRKRNRQYGLGSGLLMVWVLVTGHTINIKAPKSWPSKVIQNVWAGLAIFIMTSYTANLAAYLAGQSAVVSVNSIYDYKLLQKRVSLVHSSAVEHLLKKIKPDLYHVTRHHHVTSTIDGIRRINANSVLSRSDEADIYMDDYYLLEYELSRMDHDCKVKFVGRGFGSDGYAIGLPKHSWMRMALSNKILAYTENGFIQELSRKYMRRSGCGFFLSGSAVQYGLEHTGGLFIILLSAVFLSVILLFGEHLAYKFLVPWLRSRPEKSFWKTENLAFFSQRVYRVVRSETLYSQKQAAQEMMKIVRQRDFTRILQKNELQKRKIPPQKRIKTRAEMFQEITANIVSYNRRHKEPEETPHTFTDEDANDYSITYDVIHDKEALHERTPTSPSHLNLHHGGVNNLAFHHSDDDGIDDDGDELEVRLEMAEHADDYPDDFDDSDEVVLSVLSKRNSTSSGCSHWIPHSENSRAGRERSTSVFSTGIETVFEEPVKKERTLSFHSVGRERGALDHCMRKDRKLSVYSLGKERKASLGKGRNQTVQCKGITRNLSLPTRRKDRTLSFKAKRKDSRVSVSAPRTFVSEPTSPETRDPCEGFALPSAEECQGREFRSPAGIPVNEEWQGREFRSPPSRRSSDINPLRSGSGEAVRNNVRSHSQVYHDWDYFQRNVRLKDNRVKSHLRRHALCRHRSAEQAWESGADWRRAVSVLDSVSKEELLVLWRSSQLELQGKLRDVLHTNHRLALAIHSLTIHTG